MGLGKAVTAGEKGKIETGREGTRHHRRPEAGPLQGQEERRELQGPRRPGDRPEGHAPRQADVRVPRPPDHAGVPPREGLPRRRTPTGSTRAATTTSGSPSRRCSPKSTAPTVTFQQGMNITMVTTADKRRRGPRTAQAVRLPVPRRTRRTRSNCSETLRSSAADAQESTMATKAWIAKQKRREALVTQFADVRRQLKKEKNFAGAGEAAARQQPDAVAQPLSADRPLQGHAAEVQDLPHHAPRAGAGGQDPGH